MLMLDNHDSFTYNLLEYCRSYGEYELDVQTPEEWLQQPYIDFDKVILSPGPGLPRESRGLREAIHILWGRVPLLGVCLGLQALVEYKGGNIERSSVPNHGMSSTLRLLDQKDILYKGITDPIVVGRYHSWRADREGLPKEFVITAEDEGGVVMSIRHREEAVYAVQFHPESYITEQGERMVHNFLNFAKVKL